MNRKFERSRTNRIIFGVAGGLAEYFNINPIIPRLVFLALAFANGIGVVIYLLLALLMPRARAERAQPLQMMRENLKAIPQEVTEASRRLAQMLRGGQAFTLPVNVYRDVDRIMVAAPFPGIEPPNIHVAVEGQRLTIHGDMRGPGQDRTKQFILREWTTGPYHRTVELPALVDAGRTNVTYDNGILVVILPVADSPTTGNITLSKTGAIKGQIKGQHVGHVGQDLRMPT